MLWILCPVEATANGWIHLVGICIDIFGLFIVVAALVCSIYVCFPWCRIGRLHDRSKILIGRSLLPGLEVLVASDIVKTTATSLYHPRSFGRRCFGPHRQG